MAGRFGATDQCEAAAALCRTTFDDLQTQFRFRKAVGLICITAGDGFELIGNFSKCADDIWIEMAAAAGQD